MLLKQLSCFPFYLSIPITYYAIIADIKFSKKLKRKENETTPKGTKRNYICCTCHPTWWLFSVCVPLLIKYAQVPKTPLKNACFKNLNLPSLLLFMACHMVFSSWFQFVFLFKNKNNLLYSISFGKSLLKSDVGVLTKDQKGN